MTEQELNALVQQISLTYFQRPFKHQAIFNSRLKTTGGRYNLKNHQIDINPKILDFYDVAVLTGIIKHELCHYHLHLAGLPYQHRDRAFRQLLKQVGGSRFTPPLPRNHQSGPFKLYQCEHCGTQYFRKRRIDTAKYVCGRCRGHLKLIRVINSKNL